jgi:hypothetical protein
MLITRTKSCSPFYYPPWQLERTFKVCSWETCVGPEMVMQKNNSSGRATPQGQSLRQFSGMFCFPRACQNNEIKNKKNKICVCTSICAQGHWMNKAFSTRTNPFSVFEYRPGHTIRTGSHEQSSVFLRINLGHDESESEMLRRLNVFSMIN